MNGLILHESSRGINAYTPESSLLKKRILFFTEEVNADSSNRTIEYLLYLDMDDSGKVLLNARQYNLILKVKENLYKVLSLVERADSDEIVSFETKNILDLLNEILGIDTKEDILNTVFSKFCVGK